MRSKMFLSFVGVLFSVGYVSIIEGCGPSQADIVFILDESGSVGQTNFDKTLVAVEETLDGLDIDNGNIRTGVMCFSGSSNQRTIYDLDSYVMNKAGAISAVQAISYRGGGTYIKAAMNHVRTQMFTSGNGDRAGAENIMVVMTDGVSADDPESEANDAKALGWTVITVGIGSNLERNKLESYASTDKNGNKLFFQTTFDDLANALISAMSASVPCPYECDLGSGYERGGSTSYTTNLESNTGVTYLMTNGLSELACCGRVESWTFYPKRSGLITFQVWHPIDSQKRTYKLMGENTFYVPSSSVDRVIKYTVPDNERITVNDGPDFFGWYSPGQDMIPYDTASSSVYAKSAIIGNKNRGDTYDWNTASPNLSGRAYAVYLNLENDNSDMWFVNTGRTVLVYDHLPIGSLVYTIKVDQRDVEELSLTMSDSSGLFTFDSSTGQVTTTSYMVNGATYSLKFSASETCSRGTLNGGTVTVKVANLPPRITSLPSSAEVHEDVDVQTSLTSVDVVDDSGDSCTCSIYNSTAPNIFQLTFNSKNNYILYLIANAGLHFDSVNEYKVTIECTDHKADPVYGVFKLYVRRNVAPVISNLTPSSKQTYSSLSNMTTIIDLESTDVDDTSFTYTITQCGSNNLNYCPVWILDDQDGEVKTNRSITGYGKGGFTVQYHVTDGHTSTGPYTQSIHTIGYSNSVQMVGLPLVGKSITITEAIPTDKFLFAAAGYDIDVSSLTFTWTFTPDDGYFITKATDPQSLYTSTTQINYETLPTTSYRATCKVSDGSTSKTKSFTINILNINEAPSFTTPSFTVTAEEGPYGTQLSPFPPVTSGDYTDEDDGDTHTFTLDCGSDTRYFSINPSTSGITYGRKIDIENGAPTKTTCSISVYDKDGLSDTVPLYVNIYDINDNAPRFDRKSYTYHITPDEAVSVLGMITLTDDDMSDPHNRIVDVWFEGQPQDANGQNYFDYNNVTYELTVAKNLSQYWYGSYLEFVLKARDFGGLQSSATLTILFSATTSTTTTTTTDAPSNFMGNSQNAAMLASGGMAGAALVGLGAFMAVNS